MGAGLSPRLTRRGFTRLGAALPVGLIAPRAGAQGALWTMATEYPANTVSGGGIAFFAERLAAESNGHLTILPSYDADFGLKGAGIVEAIRGGSLAAGCSFA